MTAPSHATPRSRRAVLLRRGLAVLVVLAAAVALYLLLGLVDSALLAWQRLQQLPLWISALFGAAGAALLLGSGWLLWRLLRAPVSRTAQPDVVDRARLEQRIGALGPAQRSLQSELDELDRRRASGTVQVALFGEISAGKSSLLAALAPASTPQIAVSGGTTRQVELAETLLPDGRRLQVADVPGVHESGGDGRAALALDEAARAHALVYVADGDLTRAQHRQLQALIDTGRPLVLALNKSDRYRGDELDALLGRLRQRYASAQLRVIAISAGHRETVQREHADGRLEQVERQQPARVGPLVDALGDLVAVGATTLEPARERATLQRLDQHVDRSERGQRQRLAEQCVTRYTQRSVVGAMAAVAPGTDLLIQGALATAMIRELCQLHQLQARDIDLDHLVSRAGSTARSSTALTLAIAGNALKAFPGAGTLAGGVVHAAAYGLIFDALGRAVAATLADARRLDRDATLAAFGKALASPDRARLKALAALAWDAARGVDGTRARDRAGSRDDH